MQEVHSNNKVLNFLMRMKAEGKISGIFGRLVSFTCTLPSSNKHYRNILIDCVVDIQGDLGGIDARYDVAISTACGRLDNILVDTVDTAQECIESLKRFDIGRATFIALEKVSYLEKHSQQIKT